MAIKSKNIRNFCIIAHIDHGKSTLADRLIEECRTLTPKDMKEQVLDDMDLERERGITIRSHVVRLEYTYKDGEIYILNLIDTPGHVDFSYEVSRSLAACEGALLLVDSSQGIEAQTISNFWLALESELTIIPVINKIDLPASDPESATKQISELIGVDGAEVMPCSAKTGKGVKEILDIIIEKIPPPSDKKSAPLKALIFNSVYDNYRGAIAYIRVFEGWCYRLC